MLLKFIILKELKLEDKAIRLRIFIIHEFNVKRGVLLIVELEIRVWLTLLSLLPLRLSLPL